MKNLFFSIAGVIFPFISFSQNIGIGTPTPHASAQLDITATNKGLLIPRVALADRPASPATGLLIYQTNSTPGFYYYNGSSWVLLNFQLPYTGSTASNNALSITSTGGNGIVGASSAASGTWYGGQFTSSSTSGSGVYGAATAATGTTYGGQFVSQSTTGTGVYGAATALTGISSGGTFLNASTEGYGINVYATAATGFTKGGLFTVYSATGVGAFGQNLSNTGSAIGIQGETYSTDGIAVYGNAIASSGYTRGVFGTVNSTDGAGVSGYANATTGLNYGVSGGSASSQGVGVLGSGVSLTGANAGVTGQSNSPDGVGGSFYNNSSNNALALKTGQGQVQFNVLSGAGTRMVVANASGKLSTQSIPGSQWTTNGINIYNTNSGSVGIGVTDPVAKLEVDAGSLSETSVRFKSSSDYGVRQWYMMGNELNTALVIARLGTLVGGNTFGLPNANLSAIFTSDMGVNALAMGTKNNIPLVLGTNNAERMRIEGNGSVGIGVTPSSFVQLHVRRAGDFSAAPLAEIGAIYGENGNVNTGSGVYGISYSPRTGANGFAGVTGFNLSSSTDRFGVIGTSSGTSAVNALSAGVGGYGDYGVLGFSQTNTGAGMIAQHSSGKTALEINNGFMKVSGTNKTAFTITGTGANTSGHILTLNYANQSASDIVIVTHNYNPGGVGGSYHNIPVGVYWNGTNWTIYSEDASTPMLGKAFNVMVVKQ